MNLHEFEEYLAANSRIKDIYYEHALVFQQAKNQRRQPAKRYNDTRVDREVDKMWKPVLEMMYEQINKNIKNKNATSKDWQHFIESSNVFEDIQESMDDLTFE